jgi:glycine/D-amino acid oxidase-like deaminating enzyme
MQNVLLRLPRQANDYYPEVRIPQASIDEVQSGLRPLSPDGLPFIRKAQCCSKFGFGNGTFDDGVEFRALQQGNWSPN